jgi:hypothetical protein
VLSHLVLGLPKAVESFIQSIAPLRPVRRTSAASATGPDAQTARSGTQQRHDYGVFGFEFFQPFCFVGFHAPYWACQRWKVRSLTPERRQASPTLLLSPSIRSASRNFRMTCLGPGQRRFVLENPPAPAKEPKPLTTPGPLPRSHVTNGVTPILPFH